MPKGLNYRWLSAEEILSAPSTPPPEPEMTEGRWRPRKHRWRKMEAEEREAGFTPMPPAPEVTEEMVTAGWRVADEHMADSDLKAIYLAMRALEPK